MITATPKYRIAIANKKNPKAFILKDEVYTTFADAKKAAADWMAKNWKQGGIAQIKIY